MGVARVVPSMGANVGDIDNDGFLDVYLGTGAPSFGSLIPNILLRNDAGRRFDDVTEATGTGHLQKGHGVAFADLDCDGDEDIVLNAGGAVPGDRYDDAVFENPGTPGRHWVDLRLIGVRSNRAAIGAKIRVTVAAVPGGRGAPTRLRYREVSSGGSFGSNSYVQHVGLGGATGIESIEIAWPASKTRQVFRDPPIDTLLEIRRVPRRQWSDHRRRSVSGAPAARYRRTTLTAACSGAGQSIRDRCTGRAPCGALPSPGVPAGGHSHRPAPSPGRPDDPEGPRRRRPARAGRPAPRGRRSPAR